MKFIHTSDIRINATPDAEYEWGEKRKEELEEAFLYLISECNTKDIDLLIIAGNLFNEPQRRCCSGLMSSCSVL